MGEKLIIYTDGGARGNPGPAAIGVVMKQLQGKKEVVYKTYAETIGEATNNQAEYEAVIFALKKAKLLFGKERTRELDIEVRTDSELLARQQTGEYKVEEEGLWPYFMRLWNLKLDFKSVTFKEVPRERNREADHALNAALNKQGLF